MSWFKQHHVVVVEQHRHSARLRLQPEAGSRGGPRGGQDDFRQHLYRREVRRVRVARHLRDKREVTSTQRQPSAFADLGHRRLVFI